MTIFSISFKALANKSIIYTNLNPIRAATFQEMMCKWIRNQIFRKIQDSNVLSEITRIPEEIQKAEETITEAGVEVDISKARISIITKNHRYITKDRSCRNNPEIRVETKLTKRDIREGMTDQMTELRSQRLTKILQR